MKHAGGTGSTGHVRHASMAGEGGGGTTSRRAMSCNMTAFSHAHEVAWPTFGALSVANEVVSLQQGIKVRRRCLCVLAADRLELFNGVPKGTGLHAGSSAIPDRTAKGRFPVWIQQGDVREASVSSCREPLEFKPE